jgi:hypothetical protein
MRFGRRGYRRNRKKKRRRRYKPLRGYFMARGGVRL